MTWQGLGIGLDLGISHGLGGIGAVEAPPQRTIRGTSCAAGDVRGTSCAAGDVRAEGCA